MPQVKPKVGEKYLVRADHSTTGCLAFQEDMKRWKNTPLIVEAFFVEGKIFARGSRADSWIIRVEDLIPFKPVKLENK